MTLYPNGGTTDGEEMAKLTLSLEVLHLEKEEASVFAFLFNLLD